MSQNFSSTGGGGGEARVFTFLTSPNYCVSPLVQGCLEIPCRIEIHMPPTVKNKELIRIYQSFVDTLYYQREEANIVGSFDLDEVSVDTQNQEKQRKKKKHTQETRQKEGKSTSISKDIRSGEKNEKRDRTTSRTIDLTKPDSSKNDV